MIAERVMQDQLGSNVEHLNLVKGSSFEFWPSNGDTEFKIIATTGLKVLDVVPSPKEAGNTANDSSHVSSWLPASFYITASTIWTSFPILFLPFAHSLPRKLKRTGQTSHPHIV